MANPRGDRGKRNSSTSTIARYLNLKLDLFNSKCGKVSYCGASNLFCQLVYRPQVAVVERREHCLGADLLLGFERHVPSGK